jgi:hypothetical protein
MLQDVITREAGRAGGALSGSALSYKGMLAAGRGGYDHLAVLLSADTPVFDRLLLDPLAASLQTSLLAALQLLRCLGELLAASTIMALKLLVLVFPHILRLAEVIVDFHRTQLTKKDMLVEGIFFTLLVLFLIFRTRIAAFWLRFQRRAGKKYRVAMRYAPHVAFFVLASVFAVVGRKLLLPVCSSNTMPLLIIGYPFFQTLWRISGQHVSRYADSIKYWIVVSLYFATRRIVLLIPFSSFLFQYTYVIQVMVLIVATWIQVSPACVDIVFDAVSPVLAYYIDRIPAADFGSRYGQAVLGGLQFARLISAKNALFLQNLVADTMLVLICGAFSFMPTYLATFGVVAVVMILPAFKSSKLLVALAAGHEDGARADQVQWLKYWCCFAVLIALECFGFRLWSSVTMALFSWLQHSYFHGATKVFTFVLKEATALSDHHKKIQSAKKTAKQLELENDTDTLLLGESKTEEAETGVDSAAQDIAIPVPVVAPETPAKHTAAPEDLSTPAAAAAEEKPSSSLKKRNKTKTK